MQTIIFLLALLGLSFYIAWKAEQILSDREWKRNEINFRRRRNGYVRTHDSTRSCCTTRKNKAVQRGARG